MSAERVPNGVQQPQGLGEDPLYHITRVYLAFLQGLFSQFEPGSYRYSEDEQLTEITITNQAPIPKDRLDHRPALVAMMGPAQWANLTLDSRASEDVPTGKRRHQDLVSATMTINAIAKVPAEARRLAWIVFQGLRIHNRLLQQWGPIHQVGNLGSVGQESPPGAFVSPEVNSEFVMVTVQSPFFFNNAYEVTPLNAQRASSIEAQMNSKIGPVVERADTKMLRQPSLRGVPLPQGVPLDRVPIHLTVKS